MDKTPSISKYKDIYIFSKPGISKVVYLNRNDLKQLQKQINHLLNEGGN